MTRLSHIFRRAQPQDPALPSDEARDLAAHTPATPAGALDLDIAPNDPLVAYFESASGAIDVDSLDLDSPALAALRATGVKLVVPLVSQGELIGLLNLGPRLSDQDYSTDDRRLLDSLAAQAAPALRVGQLVREQEIQARQHERIEQELEVARLIQQNFLPRELPDLAGWEISAHYKPAREVGGDFYDFIELDGGRVAFVVGDVTDKGVPAAMVMAATRSILRATSQRQSSPAAVLRRANDLLCPDMPPKMFVTCLFAVLEPVDRGAPLRERRPQPAVRAHGERLGGASRNGHAAGPDAGDGVRGEGGRARARRVPAPLLGRPRGGARSGRRDVRLPAPAGAHGALDRLDLTGRGAARRARPLHGLGLGAGGRHHARRARTGAAAGDLCRRKRHGARRVRAGERARQRAGGHGACHDGSRASSPFRRRRSNGCGQPSPRLP